MREFPRHDRVTRTVFWSSPEPRVAILASSYYTTPDSLDLVAYGTRMSRSDTADIVYLRRSGDNGRTWTDAGEWQTCEKTPAGMRRVHPRGGYVDPGTGRYLNVWTEGVLPTDSPLEGLRNWTLWYSVSDDGGRTERFREPIIHEGPGYDAQHPLPDVTVGKSGFMMGDLGQRPLMRSDGTILIPVQAGHVDANGDYSSPGGGYTYTDCLLLMGRWQTDGRLAWRCSTRVMGDPARSTRGMIEPTLAELEGGRLLMVMRGSNDKHPEWPGWRWRALSGDGGETWSQPEPWTYADGGSFFSPSSCSQLVPWKDGRIFWLGNIAPENPCGNSPRYPFVIGEVDPRSGNLRRETVRRIDDCAVDESPHLTLSNFYAREDRVTGELLLHMTRLFAKDFRKDNTVDWTADAQLYRIGV